MAIQAEGEVGRGALASLDPAVYQRLHENRLFLDSLVDMIPPQIYFNTPAPTKAWGKQTAKERSEKAKELRELSRAGRRARLDPAQFRTSNQVLQEQQQKEEEEAVARQQQQREPEGAAAAEPGQSEKPGQPGFPAPGRARSYEELRERLQARVAALRERRHAKKAADAVTSAKEWRRKQRGAAAKKRQKDKGRDSGGAAAPGPSAAPTVAAAGPPPPQAPPAQPQPRAAASGPSSKRKAKELLEAGGIQFGRIVTDSTPLTTGRQGKAAKKQQLTESSEVGTPVWGAAIERAAGKKVLDNPRLVKRTLKQEKRAKEKSAAAWAERKQREASAMQSRQQQRTEQLQKRVQQKRDNRIAKREKKLLRPGFEGRKAGFLNTAAKEGTK